MKNIVLQAGDVVTFVERGERAQHAANQVIQSAQQAALDLRPRKPGPSFDHVPETETAAFSTKFSARDDARMAWVCDNLPKMSKQKIVKRALKEFLDRTIAEQTKP